MPRMDIVNPEIETYMRGLLDRHDEAVLLEMEAEGKERGFPIVGRTVGVTLQIQAAAIGARRVFELGSGYGYSAYWFARAVGPDGMERVLAEQGELRAFRTYQKQPAHRARPLEEQLHGFMWNRKQRYAVLLVDALDLERVPRPLDRVLAHA